MEKNTMGKIEFILWHIIWAFISMIWYRSILFRCIENTSLKDSRIFLCFLIVLFSSIGIFMERKRRRNGNNVLVNLIFAYGIYTILTYYKIRTKIIFGILGICCILIVLSTVLIMTHKVKNKWQYKKIIYRRLNRSFTNSQVIIAIGLFIINFVFGFKIYTTGAILQSSITPTTQVDNDDQTVENNIDTVLLLQEEIWKDLTIQERLDVLQTIANIEANYLGIPNELNVKTADLDDILGCYLDTTHEITIDTNTLLNESSWDVLYVLCHEAYHSYEHRLVDIYYQADDPAKQLRIFRTAILYANEFNNYENGKKDYYAYSNQRCEEDANDYAEASVEDYRDRIDKYILYIANER